MNLKRIVRGPWLWIVVSVVGVLVALQFLAPNGGYDEIDTSEMVEHIQDGSVESILFVDGDQEIRATLDNGDKVIASWVMGQQHDLVTMTQKQVEADEIEKFNVEVPKPSLLGSILATLLPFALIILLFLFLMNQVQGGGGKVMQFAKSKAKLITKDMPKTTFADVAGCQEAIEELGEIKEFLQEPAKFQAVGAKIPKGVLLYGPPGTGKTLLAKAVAGEAGVPFFSISGSDFVEMFVGVGASRVRDLFAKAKAAAPAIVFVDEIDAVGRHRGAGVGGGHDEREQTLNQLLVEMDGFDTKTGVILLASTNRPDILDPALLRPGRFDRQIVVDRPDLEGRKAILAVHAREKPLAAGVDLTVIARRTPGFTGADLANLVNEAALLSARRGLDQIGVHQLEEAIDRVMAGPERRSRLISDVEKRVIAYHEGGHALVSHALPHTDPVHKVSIIPRGRALGYTLTLPTEDRFLVRRSELVDELAMLLGGRSAEELIFADPTTGAQNDIDRATTIARQMVTEFGMSERLGPRRFGQPQGEVFLGRDFTSTPDYSQEIAASIDEEVRVLIDGAHEVAQKILTTNRSALERLAAALIEHETLEAGHVREVLGDVEQWKHHDDAGGSRPAAVATSDHTAPGPVPPSQAPKRRNTP